MVNSAEKDLTNKTETSATDESGAKPVVSTEQKSLFDEGESSIDETSQIDKNATGEDVKTDEQIAENNVYNLSEAEQEEATSAEQIEAKNSEQEEAASTEQVEATEDSELVKKRVPPPRKSPEERQYISTGDVEFKQEISMPLMDHLGELRTRLVRSFIAVALAFMVCYTFAEQLFAELCKPLVAALPEGSKLIFTALPEAFFVYLKVGLVASIFVVSPYLFYQIWAFVAPGLYDDEKKYMVPMAMISALFFISGASFCFFVVFPYAFTFFVGFASEDIAAMPSLGEYLGFSLKLLIAFGLIFEMPLFTFFLARMGIVTADRMRSFRRYAVLCIFITAAILTPPDVISQLLMAMPMMLLYEISILVAVAFGRKKKNKEDEETPAEDALDDDDNSAAEKSA